ncbi:MAG: UDP-N-acetylmuramate dehydrogenase [Patescibacteria group bacterium]
MLNKLKENLLGIEILENEPMAKHTTFRVGGPAEYYCEVNNKGDLYKVLSTARNLKLPFFIFGGGSNILVTDNGIKGVVIKLAEGEIDISGNRIKVFCGNNLRRLILTAVNKGLAGLEFAANIPGTVGGAIRGNAGAYGKGVGEFIEQVEALNIGTDEVRLEIFSKNECDFDYRHSMFKERSELIIAEAVFTLRESPADIDERLKLIEEELRDRQLKQPYECPSAGCSFKNLVYKPEYKNLKAWEIHGKVPAAKLIEEAGLKGRRIGGAEVSEKHANFIFNSDKASAHDIMELMELVKNEVKEKFGVELEEEVQRVGF